MSSYDQQIAIIDQSVKTVSRNFHNVIPKDSDIKWATEKVFALDLMRKNKDLRAATPESQQSALLQAGSMGLTLNPAAGECYLIPRALKKGSNFIVAYASPSYRGLIKAAVDSGAILYGVAEVVYAKDTFKWYGKTKEPYHEADVMKPRGKPVGVYTIAKLPNGEIIPTWMSEQDILAVKAKSDNPNGLMWKEFWMEGWCKAALRRAQKTWPRSKQLNTAIQVLNDNEGISLVQPVAPDIEGEAVKLITQEQAFTIDSKIRESFENGEEMVGVFMDWVKQHYVYVETLEDLHDADYQTVVDKIDLSIKHRQASPNV